MLAARVLALPTALMVFILLFVAANKAPLAIEAAGILVWAAWPIIALAVGMKRLLRR